MSESAYQEQVKTQYDRMAELYDRLWRRYTRFTLDTLARWIDHFEAERVLDVGCGTGELERRLVAAHPNWHLTGVDLSEKMLTVARRKLAGHPQVSFRQAPAEDLPFPENHFDLVVSASALHYFSDPEAALREMRRVLLPSGALLLLDWCRDFFTMKLLDVVLPFFDPAYRHCYTEQELHQMLRATGFCPRVSQRYRLFPHWGLMIVAATPFLRAA